MMSNYMQQFSLGGKVALVTGAAIGIGAEAAVALGTAEDVASPILYLASTASNFLTATELVVDGGISGTR